MMLILKDINNDTMIRVKRRVKKRRTLTYKGPERSGENSLRTKEILVSEGDDRGVEIPALSSKIRSLSITPKGSQEDVKYLTLKLRQMKI